MKAQIMSVLFTIVFLISTRKRKEGRQEGRQASRKKRIRNLQFTAKASKAVSPFSCMI